MYILVHTNTAYFLREIPAYEALHELVQASHKAAHISQAKASIDKMNVLAGDSDGWSLYE